MGKYAHVPKSSGSSGDATAPVGSLIYHVGATPPSGYLLTNGLTIGSAGSGATGRANADTEALYTLLWNTYAQTLFPIQTNTGAAATRGVSASADFVAGKRMPLPNYNGIFLSAAGSQVIGAITYNRALGAKQNDQFRSHQHSWRGYRINGGNASLGRPGNNSDNDWEATHWSDPSGGTETNPANQAVSVFIKY